MLQVASNRVFVPMKRVQLFYRNFPVTRTDGVASLFPCLAFKKSLYVHVQRYNRIRVARCLVYMLNLRCSSSFETQLISKILKKKIGSQILI